MSLDTNNNPGGKSERVVRIKLEPDYQTIQKVPSMSDLLEETSLHGE